MVFWKAFIDRAQEFVADVGGNVGAVRWTKPYNVSASRTLWVRWLRVELEVKLVVVSGFFEGFFYVGESSVDGF